MPKLEYTPVNDWTKFNYLGKRLFDFANDKINMTAGTYVGNGTAFNEIQLDLIPKMVVIFSEAGVLPVVWAYAFPLGLSKTIDGINITDGILGISNRRSAFILGTNTLVNDVGINYTYIVFGV